MVDEYTTQFHLRPGVKFHNGETMNAEDVKFSLERCMASDGVNYNYKIIESVEIVDDMTVVVKTKTPFNAMPTRLSLDAASIVSKKQWRSMGMTSTSILSEAARSNSLPGELEETAFWWQTKITGQALRRSRH